MNPFLSADALAKAENGDPSVKGAGDPLGESLARLKTRKDQLKDSAVATAGAAQDVGSEAQAMAQDTISETRQALGESLDQAEARGKQLAYDTAEGAELAARSQAARAVDGASQAIGEAQGLVESANQQLQDVQQLVSAYRQADLPASARQELAKSLEQLSASADTQVRVGAARAMGETRDPAFLPALMVMLNDQPQVQTTTLASLQQITGQDAGRAENGKPVSDAEKVQAWQLWYREQQDAAAK
jgi:hypothetical protein